MARKSRDLCRVDRRLFWLKHSDHDWAYPKKVGAQVEKEEVHKNSWFYPK